MDTIDFLIGARINNSTAPMQRCRAQNSNHKHGASNAFVKEWPTQPSPSTRIPQSNTISLHPSLNRFRFEDEEDPSQCIRDGSAPPYEVHDSIRKKLPELVITTSSPTTEEGRRTGTRSSGGGGKRSESPAKKYLRSWTA
ncbi:hypothetical protein KC316_g14662 [Hortaea werneckii]|nr:hypothetical protein KC324_g14547 [Hortaea werneckii]KAI7547293.1 hypothetical protein KC316_g14662 [Hortaea werneckii]